MACFPAHLTSCICSMPFTDDIFSLAFHRRHFPALFSSCAFYLQCVFPRFLSVTCFPALALHYKYVLVYVLIAITFVAVFLQALSFSLQILDSNDSQRLLDGMFNKTALSCSILRLLRSRQVHWFFLSEVVILDATIYTLHFLLLICRWLCKGKE